MYFAIPDFVAVPSAGTLQTISIVSLIVGFCLVGAGLLCLFWHRKKGNGKKAVGVWIFIGIGALLIVNHGMQLLF